MKLYSGSRSPAGKRIRICCLEMGVPIEPCVVDFQKGEQRAPDYLALNPMGKVPTIKDGDFVLWESAAVLCYVAEQYGNETFWPKDPQKRAEIMRWLFFCSCHIDPYFTTIVVERFLNPRLFGKPTNEVFAKNAEEWLARFLPVVNDQLGKHAFITGESMSIVDIALGTTLELQPLVGLEYTLSPNIPKWLARLHSRASWGDGTQNVFIATPA